MTPKWVPKRRYIVAAKPARRSQPAYSSGRILWKLMLCGTRTETSVWMSVHGFPAVMRRSYCSCIPLRYSITRSFGSWRVFFFQWKKNQNFLQLWLTLYSLHRLRILRITKWSARNSFFQATLQKISTRTPDFFFFFYHWHLLLKAKGVKLYFQSGEWTHLLRFSRFSAKLACKAEFK